MPLHTLRRAGAIVLVTPFASFASLSCLAALWGIASPAAAEIVQTSSVGLGTSTSTIQIDFTNGNGYLFSVHYDAPLTGWSALQLIAGETPGFTLVAEQYPWGAFVTGLGVAGDYEYGTGDLWPDVENYWHYWVQDDAHAWQGAGFGPSDFTLFNGSAEAWVFGSSATPQAVPAGPGAALLACAATAALRGRRRATSCVSPSSRAPAAGPCLAPGPHLRGR